MNRLHLHPLLFAAAIGLGAVPLTAQAAPASIPTDGTIADVAERTVDSVVNIDVSHTEKNRFGRFQMDPFGGGGDPFGWNMPQKTFGKGSGVIVTASGRILTNAHVVDDADDIKVTLQDGTEVDAKVIGKDTHADLAVIQLKGKFPTLKPIPFGDSTALRLGEIVLAVGDGMGIGKSVSMGIVSAKGRQNLGIEEFEDFIQTDATINPGNSGGALVNLKGELVGINTAIASRSGGSQGIGFAIPTHMARPIMDILIRDGKFARGYLGVNIATVTPAILKEHKLGSTTGVVITGVAPDGPAARTSLGEGDVVVGLDGKPIKTNLELRTAIAGAKPGATVALDVAHPSGKRETIKAKLGELPEQRRR